MRLILVVLIALLVGCSTTGSYQARSSKPMLLATTTSTIAFDAVPSPSCDELNQRRHLWAAVAAGLGAATGAGGLATVQVPEDAKLAMGLVSLGVGIIAAGVGLYADGVNTDYQEAGCMRPKAQ